MRNIRLIVPVLFACVIIAACSGLNPMQNAFKEPLHPAADVPKDIRNSKPDAQLEDEKTIFATVADGTNYYIGRDLFTLDNIQPVLERQMGKNPPAKQSVYLNAAASAEYGSVVRILDQIRRTNAESISLLVYPAAPADKKLQVLKIKTSAEPREDDPVDLLDKRLVINLQKDGKIKLGRFDKWSFKATTPEIADAAEIGGKLAPLLKENEEKKINLQGTSEPDKTVFVKASRANRYGEVVRLVDAALGAGASEVYLMLDDLEG